MVLVTHHVQYAKYADRVLCLNDDGTPASYGSPDEATLRDLDVRLFVRLFALILLLLAWFLFFYPFVRFASSLLKINLRFWFSHSFVHRKEDVFFVLCIHEQISMHMPIHVHHTYTHTHTHYP